MTEKRLLMTGENLAKIRQRLKTQTRRVIKPQPIPVGEFEKGSPFYWEAPYKTGCADTGLWYRDDEGLKFHCKSPYQVGDLAWIPETWKIGAWRFDITDGKGDRIAIDYKASPEITHTPWIYPNNIFDKLIKESQEDCIKAYEDNLCGAEYDDRGLIHNYTWEAGQSPCRWRNSRFMYKCFAREWVRIKSVRAERLQDITAMDIEAEGILNENTELSKALELWIKLWNSINGETYPWSSNPWVWVYEFERIER